jgi:hypothetical protein
MAFQFREEDRGAKMPIPQTPLPSIKRLLAMLTNNRIDIEVALLIRSLYQLFPHYRLDVFYLVSNQLLPSSGSLQRFFLQDNWQSHQEIQKYFQEQHATIDSEELMKLFAANPSPNSEDNTAEVIAAKSYSLRAVNAIFRDFITEIQLPNNADQIEDYREFLSIYFRLLYYMGYDDDGRLDFFTQKEDYRFFASLLVEKLGKEYLKALSPQLFRAFQSCLEEIGCKSAIPGRIVTTRREMSTASLTMNDLDARSKLWKLFDMYTRNEEQNSYENEDGLADYDEDDEDEGIGGGRQSRGTQAEDQEAIGDDDLSGNYEDDEDRRDFKNREENWM